MTGVLVNLNVSKPGYQTIEGLKDSTLSDSTGFYEFEIDDYVGYTTDSTQGRSEGVVSIGCKETRQ